MQSRRDQSVLRSLALSFGEGLAFSVGAKLLHNAARPPAGMEIPDFAPIAERLEQLEQRIQKAERPREAQQLDQKVIQVIVNALETRLQDHSGRIERRLADFHGTVQSSIAQRIESETAALREEVHRMHSEFAATVARVVGEQVALRAAEMEPAIHERVAAAIAPLQAELAEVRARLIETENTMAEFVSAISMMCRKAAERNEQGLDADESAAAGSEVAAPAPPEPEPAIASHDAAASSAPLAPGPGSAPCSAEPVLDLPIPAFAQTRKPPGTWRIPVASSFAIAFAAVGLLMRIF